MAIVTYKANGDAREIEWHGVAFVDGEPVETDDKDLVAAAKGNRFFEVIEDAAEPARRGRPPGAAKEAGE